MTKRKSKGNAQRCPPAFFVPLCICICSVKIVWAQNFFNIIEDDSWYEPYNELRLKWEDEIGAEDLIEPSAYQYYLVSEARRLNLTDTVLTDLNV